ncbi:DUF4403 family protein [Larkinella insperata]|uniref:DUF4403 family protein n=1 Tax=Larkinella insperata TaxID=332158 RepID=A0ABW3QBT2_9BACT|nr:DUF4403 family protein [Larkinella insperata]
MTTPSLLRLLFGLALSLFLTNCQKTEPQAPPATGFDPAIPSSTSYLAGPITFTIQELQKKINQELDPVLVGKGSPGGKKGGVFPFRVVRSGPVRIQYVNNQVRFSAPLSLFVSTPFTDAEKTGNKPFCSLHVNFQSPLTVTPNWRLASKVQFTDYDWIVEPEIRLLGKEISLTNFAKNVLDRYQSAIESAIDSAVYNELRLDQMVMPIWKSIQKPLLIEKQYGLWLLPKPVAVEAGPINGDSVRITTHLRIAFETSTKLQPQEPEPSKVPLPQLEKKEQVSQISDLRITSFIPYADINRMLARSLNGEKKLLLGALTIKKAAVYGGQRSLIVKTDVSGLIDGTIYLRGRPAFDSTSNTLSVRNLDFDSGTISELPRAAGSLVKDGLVKALESFLTVPLGGEMEKLPQKINQSFEKGGPGKKTDLAIQSFRLTPQQVAIRPDGIQALILVKSKVAVRVQQL